MRQRSLLIFLTVFLMFTGAFCGTDKSSIEYFRQGNSFYKEKKYDSAIVYYERALDGGKSGEIFYNLGNAYYRKGSVGAAVLYYEKALKLMPDDKDVKANLRYVNAQIVDRVPQPEEKFLAVLFSKAHNLLPLNVQLWLLFVLLLVLSLLFNAWLFSSYNRRLWIVYLSSLIIIVTLFTGISAGLKIYANENAEYGVLLESAADVLNEPGGPKVLFTVHEGTKLHIRKTEDGWALVSLPNGMSGWIPAESFGKI